MDIRSLYYQKFLRMLANSWHDEIKLAKPGHCMKVTGLTLTELRQLYPMLKECNSSIDTYILSEEETGPEYIHATKLIELRNDGEKGVLALIPVNNRTSAEDSYGDATFKDFRAGDMVGQFATLLCNEVPAEKKETIFKLFDEIHDIGNMSQSAKVNYLLMQEINDWTDTSIGEGLYFFGLLPDSLLLEKGNMTKRLRYNARCISILGDFSASVTERVASLPLKPSTIQPDLIALLNDDNNIYSIDSLCKVIYESHPNLYFSQWDINKDLDQEEEIFVTAEFVPGQNIRTELVKTLEGDYTLQIPLGKTSTVKVKMGFNPQPKKNDKIRFYSIELVRYDDMVKVGEIKRGKLPSTTGSSKTIQVKITSSHFENGSYFLRCHVLDEDGLVLDTNNPFKYPQVEAKWQERYEADETKTLTRAMFQNEEKVLMANETEVFSLHNQQSDDDEPTTDDDIERQKRSHPDILLQAYFHYAIEQLRKGDNTEIPVLNDHKWKEGSLIDVFSFDFGSAYAYTIQIPRKLLELERAFYRHSGELGSLEADISGNPTDTKVQDIHFHALPANINVPSELIELRRKVFGLIQESADSESGVLATFPLYNSSEIVEEYVKAYAQWVDSLGGCNMTDTEVAAIPNLDTVLMNVEMPDGSHSRVKLITPFHPLRLAWLVNLLHLYRDWEARTQEEPKFKSQWYKNLDQLFLGKLSLEVAPLVLTEGALSIFQYVGELTFGWGFFAENSGAAHSDFSSENRQLKSYVSSLLNVAREKQIDSDVTLELVKRHLDNFVKSHPYVRKLVINLFNVGDANVFADAIVALERACGRQGGYEYEIRIFANNQLIRPGSAMVELVNPTSLVAEGAEAFAQAADNRLFPKMRFSVNDIDTFVNDYSKYQAHISFLVNPFAISITTVRPEQDARSFFVNGTVFKSNFSEETNSEGKVWSRYFANRQMPETVDAFANEIVKLFSNIQFFLGKTLSSTTEQSVVATSLALNSSDAIFLNFVHEVSDWVVTFDKNMGPEFYDVPVSSKGETPYLLDYIPGQEHNSVSSFLTTRPTSEVNGLMAPLFKKFGVAIDDPDVFMSLLEDVRTISSSLVMQVNTTQNKAFEVLGTTLTKRFFQKKGLIDEAFMIPIDLHKELFEKLDTENKERADTLLVNLDPENREIIFTVTEIKCRQSLSQSEQDDLEDKMMSQIENTIAALQARFDVYNTENDRLDRELKTLELSAFLSFYAKRAERYAVLDSEVAHEYLHFLADLGNDYTIRFKRLGIIYNFSQHEKQKKSVCNQTTFYSMGESVIQDILSPTASLDTNRLYDSADDHELLTFFEPKRKDAMLTSRTLQQQKDRLIQEERQATPEVGSIVNYADNNANDHSQQPEATQPQLVVKAPEPEYVPVSLRREMDYAAPVCDVLLGKDTASTQYGILGKMATADRLVGIDLAGCNTVSLFGVQGAGKSYTIGSVVEMVLKQFSRVNKLPAPLASVIFHYSDSMDYAPEFTSMTFPNDEAAELERLKAVYGAEADSVKDVVLLAPENKVEQRKAEYPNVEVYPIAFDSKELQVKDWMFLLGAMGNDSAYLRVLTQIMRTVRNDLSIRNIRRGIKTCSSLSSSQKELAEMRVSFAEEYIRDGNKLQQYLRPGRLIIVDLRDELIQKDEALGLFVVMLNIFSSVLAVDGQRFNKFIVFDEAHKYMNNKELVGSITTAIREMRHKGVSVMIASQDPMSLPTEIIELSSIVILHRFNSPQWLKHVQKTITSIGSLNANDMARLGSGEAYVWAAKATDKAFTTRPIRVQIRPRVTKHGGSTIQATDD